MKAELQFAHKLMMISACGLGLLSGSPQNFNLEVSLKGWMDCVEPFPDWDFQLLLHENSQWCLSLDAGWPQSGNVRRLTSKELMLPNFGAGEDS